MSTMHSVNSERPSGVNRTSWSRTDLLALVVLALGITIFHAQGLGPGRTFLPVDLANNNLPWRSGDYQPLQNYLISDPLYEFYPFLSYAVDTVRETRGWPLWNPYIMLGHPVSGDPIAQPFYPFFVALGVVLGAARGQAIGLWLHALLAAVLTYAYLRAIRCRPYAAVLGAFTYAIGGYMVTWFEAMHRVSTMSWLPGILWAYERAIQRRSVRYVAAGAAMVALAILGGQFQFVATFCLFFGLYALGRALEALPAGKKAACLPVVVMVAMVGLGVLLGAIQIVPFVESLGGSQRVVSQGLGDVLQWRQLITLIVPHFYGNPTVPGDYTGQFNFSEGTIYAGVVALLLACLAPFRARRPFSRYVFVLTAGLLYFAVGGPGVQMLGSTPVLKYVSLHRSVFLLPLLVGLLAATALSERDLPARGAVFIGCVFCAAIWLAMRLNWGGATQWDNLRGPVVRAVLLLAPAAVLLVLRERFPKGRTLANLGLAGLVFVDLFAFGSRFSPSGPIAQLLPATPAIDYLRAQAGSTRVVAYQSGELLFGPNVLSIYRIAEAGGYSSIVSGRYRQLVRAADPKVDVWWMDLNENMIVFSRPSPRLLDLMQVNYVLSVVPLDVGITAEVAPSDCLGDGGEIAGARTANGTFAVRDSVINRLDLRFRVRDPQQVAGGLTVRMWQGPERSHLVLEAQLDSAKLQDEQAVTLYFEPQRDAPGRSYAWEIAATGEVSRTGIALCSSASGEAAIAVYGSELREVYRGEVYVYERFTALPKAYVVYAVEHIADDAATVKRLLEPSFDARNVAIVAQPLELPVAARSLASPVEIVTYQDTRVVVQAEAAQPGLLVLTDQFDPGWRATVDGKAAAIVRANHVLRGVVLPSGQHQVVFEFAPASLRTGGLLSLCGILVLLVVVAVGGRRRAPG